ncbi:MAG: aspartyl-tRNA(Asn)/glutamyl-tRNA(Gln) amidotransferase subunit [Acetobacteraceae bacterium]|nr:aspartyl-tRNA(Asn)/glutamyl-tRNA(Gln) amidotransferase subunit [Acetobacteraceae bacterium]
MRRIDELAQALAEGTTTSRSLIEESLARIGNPDGEGARAFIKVHAGQARAMADAADLLRKVNRAPGPYAGIPIALKDLFDIAGEPTPAGSAILADAPEAKANAPVVARMLGAGFIPVGRVNMTEFAFSGLGINPHYGTPSSPWDRASKRIPGGSSSGTAVAVADGMAAAGLGTDSGGSCRIPAAFCGIVGYKPTARRIPISGVLPLAPSLDSVGPLARSVACCAEIDAILAGETPAAPIPARLHGLRFATPDTMVLDRMDETVAAAFDTALSRLSAAGARIEQARFSEFDELTAMNARGGFAASEAYAWHRHLLATRGSGYDPRIRVRIARGEHMSAADYLDLLNARRRLIAEFDRATAPYDCVLMPTVPIVAPRIADLNDERAYNSINMLILRNTALGNFFDRCAISVPCHRKGDAPVGLMLMGETMGDGRLFTIAAAVEAALG